MERPAKSGRWWVRLYHYGREHRFGVFPNKTSAGLFYQKAKREQVEQRFDPDRYHAKKRSQITIGEWIDHCVAGCTLAGRPAWKRYGAWWKKIIGNRSLNETSASEFRVLRARLLKRSELGKGRRGPSTINRYFGWLRRIYNMALQDGKAERNPLTRFGQLPEPDGPDRVLSNPEEANLKDKMAQEDFDLILIALHTGMRQSEQFKLRWQQVDFDHGEIVLRQTKSGRPRRIPLDNTALAALRRQKSWMASPYVFPSLTDSNKPRNATNFYHRIYEPALKAAGLTGMKWHTLRHTTATRLMAAGVDHRTIMGIMGWTRIEMLARYTHLIPSKMREAVKVLDPKP